MKSSQLIKIDSISSGDSDKKKNCRRAIIKRCTGAVEAFWKRKANPNRILYVKRIVGTHKEIHTSHIIVKNGGNGSNTLFQFTHTPKKKRFFLVFSKTSSFYFIFIHEIAYVHIHTLSATREAKKARTLHCTISFIFFSWYTDHRNETKKAENSEQKNVIGKKNFAFEQKREIREWKM